MTRPQIRVLIIDDDIVDRKACQRALKQNPDYDFVLAEAETGQEGLQLAQAEKPDCILLDYRLPDLDGLEFLAELRNETGEIPIPVMMLTGADNALVAVEAMKRGARDYLVKDVERQYLELLPAVIGRLMEERRLQDEKQVAEAKYRTLVEQTPAITYVAALDGKDSTFYVSPQIRDLGFSPEEWLADPEIHLKQIHPDDRLRVEEQLSQSRSTGKPLCCEYRLRARNGTIFWYRDLATVVRDEAGQPLVLQGILVDISKSKQMEQELWEHRHRLEEVVMKRTNMLTRANEQLRQDVAVRQQVEAELFEERERSRAVLGAIAEGVIGVDGDGSIRCLNPAAERFTGWQEAEALGQPLAQVFAVADETSRRPVASLAALSATGGPAFFLKRRDGSEMSIRLSSIPVHDRHGKPAGAVVVFGEAAKYPG